MNPGGKAVEKQQAVLQEEGSASLSVGRADKRLRILMLTQFFDPEPGFFTGLPLAKWFVQRGHQVEVLTGFPNYPGGRFYHDRPVRVFERQELEGVKVTRVILYPSHDQSAKKRAANYLSFAASASALGTLLTRRYDVTYVYHPPATTAFPAVLWKHTRRQPFVYHVQDLWPDSVMKSGMVSSKASTHVETILSWWSARTYREASSIAAIAPSMKRLLVDRGVPSDKVELIPNWTDEEIFFPRPYDHELAEMLGLTNSFNIVYSGNLGLYQGLESVVRAARLAEHLEGLNVIFIGSGQVEPRLKALVKELDVKNVTFLGRLPYAHMGRVNSIADMLLVSLRDLPFFRGTIPSKTQAALASGRPIIMAVAGDAADLVAKAEAGIICEPDNEQALAETFEKAYNLRREELDLLGARGAAYYQRELALSRGAERLEKIMSTAANERGT